MENKQDLEIWMQGPIAGVTSYLQPAVHALLQVNKDIQQLLKPEDEKILWHKPFGMATPGFHVLHIMGVVDRMITYAKDESLSDVQFEDIAFEKQAHPELSIESLKNRLEQSINNAVKEYQKIQPETLSEIRYLGRKRIPTTQIGLLFHAAEHAQRHFGQLLVSINVVRNTALLG